MDGDEATPFLECLFTLLIDLHPISKIRLKMTPHASLSLSHPNDPPECRMLFLLPDLRWLSSRFEISFIAGESSGMTDKLVGGNRLNSLSLRKLWSWIPGVWFRCETDDRLVLARLGWERNQGLRHFAFSLAESS